jgi:pimeloyl-ACP methyl ester carboxylesterase/DNA-binding winged helix-turn-helix (wHTH) protein
MTSTVYTFGPFRLEPDERRLLRDRKLLPLAGKAFDALLVLVQGAGMLQTQRTLFARLWPDVVVDPNNLQYQISVIRRVLGSTPDVEIETVRGQGYRLVADIRRGATDKATPRAKATSHVSAAFGRQRSYICKSADGARLAYALVGSGPPLIHAAHWLGHLELDWENPVWASWLDLLGKDRCLVRYDARGHGLSDRDLPSLTFESLVSDLGAVFDAAGIERAPVLGISQGAAVAAAYAARNPGRVSALVLLSGYARGWRVKGDPALIERYEAVVALMRQAWGADNAVVRQMFTTTFFPDCPPHHVDWFNELLRQTTTPANAAQMLSSLGHVDIRRELASIRASTLVLHNRGDMVVPMADGMELASGIPGARFVPLDSKGHFLHPDEPAWERCASELSSFLAEMAGETTGVSPKQANGRARRSGETSGGEPFRG